MTATGVPNQDFHSKVPGAEYAPKHVSADTIRGKMAEPDLRSPPPAAKAGPEKRMGGETLE